MSLLAVGRESFATQLLAVVIGGYKLCDARETPCAGRNIITEIDQQIAYFDGLIVAADCYWRFRCS